MEMAPPVYFSFLIAQIIGPAPVPAASGLLKMAGYCDAQFVTMMHTI